MPKKVLCDARQVIVSPSRWIYETPKRANRPSRVVARRPKFYIVNYDDIINGRYIDNEKSQEEPQQSKPPTIAPARIQTIKGQAYSHKEYASALALLDLGMDLPESKIGQCTATPKRRLCKYAAKRRLQDLFPETQPPKVADVEAVLLNGDNGILEVDMKVEKEKTSDVRQMSKSIIDLLCKFDDY